MALTSFTFGKVGHNVGGGSMPALVVDGTTQTTENIAPVAGNTQTTATASTVMGGLCGCRVTTDTNVYVSFGSNPNATSDTSRVLVLANQVEYFFILSGYKAAAATA